MLQHEEFRAKPGWFMHDNTRPHYAPSSLGLVKALQTGGSKNEVLWNGQYDPQA
jgi:hypothetical protein